MPVKITKILTRPNVNVPWPSASMFGMTSNDTQRTWGGFLDSSREVSADGLTMRTVEFWKDGHPDMANLTASQNALSAKYTKYCTDNNIVSSKTVEQI